MGLLQNVQLWNRNGKFKEINKCNGYTNIIFNHTCTYCLDIFYIFMPRHYIFLDKNWDYSHWYCQYPDTNKYIETWTFKIRIVWYHHLTEIFSLVFTSYERWITYAIFRLNKYWFKENRSIILLSSN